MVVLSYPACLFGQTRKLRFQNYIRVLRGLDTEAALHRDFPGLDRGELPQTLEKHDRLRILDLPDESQQAENVAAVTTLSAVEIFEKAAESPDQLSEPELELLYCRLWSNVSDEERKESSPASLWLNSKYGELFDPVQALALRKVRTEYLNRALDRIEAQKLQESLEAMQNARPWVQQLYKELCTGDPQACWGYAMFMPPNLNWDFGELHCALSPKMQSALSETGAGDFFRRRLTTYDLPWPQDIHEWSAEDAEALDIVALRQTIGFAAADEHENRQEQEDEQVLTAVAHKLRARFCSIRAGPGRTDAREETGLRADVLTNVFLVFPRKLVGMLIDEHRSANADDMWMWAVDPDFDQSNEPTTSGYHGFVRVRVPQLVNNFFALRRYRAEEYPMKTLWDKAQRSHNKAFVSLEEEYFHDVSHMYQKGVAVDLKPPMPNEVKTARPWVQQLYEQISAFPKTTYWGFAMFLPPNLSMRSDDFLCSLEPIFSSALSDMHAGRLLQRRFMPYALTWPVGHGPSEPFSTNTSHQDEGTIEAPIASEARQQHILQSEQQQEAEDEEALRLVLPQLRARFRSLRAGPPMLDTGEETGLLNDILRNTFFVVPRRLPGLLSDSSSPDYMWLWAVDPDFDEEAPSSGYQGHLRVRVPQLVNNFFELRRYRAQDYPMKRLWEKAQLSHNQAFVSLEERYFHEISHSRQKGVGVDFRPPVPETEDEGDPWTREVIDTGTEAQRDMT